MTLKQNSIQFAILCFAVGLFAAGCDQVSTMTETNAVSDTTIAQTTPGDCCLASTESASCCGQCAAEQKPAGESEGCCGKCAEEQELVSQKTEVQSEAGCCGKCAEEQQALVSQKSEGCGDCTACADGDSTNCKCAGEESVSIAASKEEVAADHKTSELPSESKVNSFSEDRDVFHFLLANNDKIRRTVTELENGVETLTESADPEIVGKIQEHVASMYRRVEDVRPIRMRDPLYREIFQHADQIEMQVENTTEGIKVTETSSDEYVVKLIQAHAKVVSGFVEKGFAEARKNHEPPQMQ